ncbi:uncharacterized protein C8R40DRAFT_474720 [Lentinula edodes]|uniref:uncharacterized protein n=1 Tax=Lentinula edodes TaxID=5353 RepID=UPI001E8D6083|nr:uncharacterized protein C8R40DRAFT_474720 [Lentinula edodes]KAH7872601.1 hypothetical protein C8R40DRAFT_474720 [Lentinula edodes]
MLPPRAYFFIGLNIIRVLSIVALVLVFASNIVTLVHDVEAVNRFMAAKGSDVSASNSTITDMLNCDYIECVFNFPDCNNPTNWFSSRRDSTVPNQPAGIFWAVLNRLLIIGQTVVLVLSELGWPSKFFDRFFPVLGKDFGLGALGVIQCLIGAAILSHFVDDFTLVSAFFLFSIGCLNIFVGLIFRQGAKSKRSITSWREHAKSALPTHVAGVPVAPIVTHAPSFVSNVFGNEKERHSTASDGSEASTTSSKASLGFGRQGEKAAAMKGYFISKPLESLPRYAPK